ncbi:DNA polymerase III subunit delta' [Alteromonas lipolytica]|uniref:DNA-directed DNA polymerase n=1 Tax=Alteromonas lipolytica TaxID=1856405 RepID=A0A1E8FJ90_9ALTE|nr:DNA polymerase III subunit delta' [Alteromonas lipolytica]OFI35816.1 DNA polymerase III subunit delta' [Alteromonas lipolytica]GGF81065.1 DNA polymerase III subunit delta' [Alteromonas lipolytica]
MLMLPWLENRFQQLIERFQRNSLHHGILLSGPQGVGKRELADALLQTILCLHPSGQGACGECQSCKLINAGNHPDRYVLESEKLLGVDAIREAIGKLNTTAQIGRHKVLIIPAAERMTEAASNALLKTLEEPTDNTYLLLLTHRIAGLLPTILSRCEKHVIATPSPAQSLQWLASQGHTEVDNALLNAYGNAPLRVAEALSDESTLSYREFVDGLEALLGNNQDVTEVAGKWQEQAEQVISWCQQYFHDQYCKTQRKEDLQRYQHCIAFAVRVRHPGVNKVLLLSQIFSLLKQA